MIVKLRESHIARLERLRKKEKTGEADEEDTKDREMVCLFIKISTFPFLLLLDIFVTYLFFILS